MSSTPRTPPPTPSRTSAGTSARTRWAGRRPAAAVALACAALVGLTSCGTVPPTSPPGGSARGTTAAPLPGAGRPSGSASPVPSPAHSTPGPTADVWVGHFHGHRIEVPRGHGATMSFTFDDGPWPGSTQRVLALLAQHQVHAVFCLVGDQARAKPALVHAEVAAGHELCDHSRDHDIVMGRKGQAYVDAEVGDGLQEVTRAAPAGTPVTFYRQPGGTWDAKVVKAMESHDLDPLRWSDDPKDWSRPGSLTIVRRVVANLTPGGVVLMHDGGGDRSQSVEALRFLLGAVVAAGWKPVLAPHVTLSPKAAAKPQ